MLIRYGNESQLTQFGLLCNTEEAGLFSNVASSSRRGLPMIEEMPPNELSAIICGGGPSLADTLVKIRQLKALGGKIFALNNAAKFLDENGIRPDYQILIDPRPQNIVFIEQQHADMALLCSQVHPILFDKCAETGYPVTLWHPSIDGIGKYIEDKEPLLVSVTLSIGLSCLSLIHVLGYRDFHLFGYDSSHAAEKSHAYMQPMNAQDEIVRCAVDNQVFYSSMAMAGQAADFQQVTSMIRSFGGKIEVYGSGLVPTLWEKWKREESARILTAVYDLGVSPPSYDFLSFLLEAERYRLANSYSAIDIMFQPGPMYGFRDDDLPPGREERQWMLWSICVGMARLLPTVRNIDVKGTRWHPGSGDIFPEGYMENQPKSHYGTGFLKGGSPLLCASDFARSQAKKIGHLYATISIRNAPYWPDRNSNIAEWDKVASWLWLQGIEPIFIPDANAENIPKEWRKDMVAAQNIDLRAGLYEGAVINLGVLNGPMSLLPFLKAKYLIFNIVVETAVASSTEFLKAHGFEHGDQMGGDGRLVWEKDTAEVIIRELKMEITSHVTAISR